MAAKPHEVAHIEGQLSFLADDPMPSAPEPVALPDFATSDEPIAHTEAAESMDPQVISGPNTRLRAGNAMHRAREGVIRGALETIARRGLKGLTMVEAADRGGLARATLYNHARDKAALLELVLDRELGDLARNFVEAERLEDALAAAATTIADHPALAGIRQHDPVALARLTGATDERVHRLASDALLARGCGASETNVDMTVRWLASFIAVPSDRPSREAQAQALAKLLA